MTAECKTCGDPQSQHKGGTGGCRRCFLGCARYEPEEATQPVVEPVPAEDLAAVAADARAVHEVYTEAEAAEEIVRLHEVEAELHETQKLVDQKQERLLEMSDLLTTARAEREQVERARDNYREGRDQATERALELAAELSTANARVHELAGELEQATAEIERLRASADGYLLAGTDGMPLLDQADATGVPAIQGTSDSIRELIGQLREQLAEHGRLEELRTELGRLEEKAAEIRRVLAEAEKPPAPVVPDKTIRDWARKNGFEVDPRGRVPVWLRTQYLHANPTTVTTRSSS